MTRADLTQSITEGRENGRQHGAHVLLIPVAALPHITPMMHLAQHLVSRGGITCTILAYDFLINNVDRDGLSDSVHLLGVKKNLTGFVQPRGWVPDVDSEELHCTVNVYLQDFLEKKAAGEQVPTYTCLISDFLLYWTITQLLLNIIQKEKIFACFDLEATASKLECSRYIFAPVSAYFTLITASFDLFTNAGEARTNSWLADTHMPEPKPLKNGTPFHPLEMNIIKSHYISMMGAKGVLINTFYELESTAIDYLRDMGRNIIPVGPLQSCLKKVHVGYEDWKHVDNECLQWLDEQPVKSVVYINFGTTGFNFFTLQMVHELALGLEASQARFLWILRPPPDLTSYELEHLLPDGFEERLKDRALISRGWAPQLKILEHPSTAAFCMHVGWNSLQEAVVRGIPFIGWPTFGDQPFNALYAAEVAKVGILLPNDEKRVDRQDVETAVRTIIFSDRGQFIKRRAEEMRIAAENATKPGGLSHKGIEEVADASKPRLGSFFQHL